MAAQPVGVSSAKPKTDVAQCQTESAGHWYVVGINVSIAAAILWAGGRDGEWISRQLRPVLERPR